ncbi:alpha/beta hydrolase family protein [Azospirillum doebereinerae]|uniref:alpha/beta hydrolase family protein n=1 Tax=Azospirillum doebereinerae TaxID=92933 RepID=UPI001EE5CA0A|nr:dienelactone hydrolase family protein [Azospirillum doebereinerae]MCG5242712.1 dienelactone hydrolase family protein [Azospirillum doebereinerae]
MAILLRALLALLLLTAAGEAGAGDWGVGIRRLTVADPVAGGPMDVVVVHPSPTGASPTGASPAGPAVTRIGPYDVSGVRDAAVAEGRFPVVALSHGSLGSPLGHHDLATALAKRGFVVVAPAHPGDNVRDDHGLGAVSTLFGRPMQVSAALEAVLADAALAPHVDAARVGVAGFSAGGETALILAGARPEPERLLAYCAGRLDDRDLCAARGRMRLDRPDLGPVGDGRVKALFLMAPKGVLFGAAGLEAVRVPVRLYAAERDGQLGLAANAGALARDLPARPVPVLLEGAGHFVFLAPCSTELAAAAPFLCRDPEGVDRAGLHDRINADAAAFFTTALGAPR